MMVHTNYNNNGHPVFSMSELHPKLSYVDTHLYLEKPLDVIAFVSQLPRTGKPGVNQPSAFSLFNVVLPFIHLCGLNSLSSPIFNFIVFRF